MAIHMKHIPNNILSRLTLLVFVTLCSSYADIASDVLAFTRCHYTTNRVVKSYYKENNVLIQIGDTLFSFPKTLNCADINVESVDNRTPCENADGDINCLVAAWDALLEDRYLLLNYPYKGKNRFYLKESNGKEKKLNGEMLWGLGRRAAFMRDNVVVLLYRNEEREYELITYKIIKSAIKKVKSEKYPYEMTTNSWAIPKDYIFPCDGKMCIYNNKTKTIKVYKNEFLPK